jgi:hypothetical protein
MTQDEQARIESFARIYDERQQHSRDLLGKIDRLEVALAASDDKNQRRSLERENSALRRRFAEHLGDETYIEQSTSRAVVPIWLVAGVPAKSHRDEARQWMNQRGLNWAGPAPPLRHEVRKALEKHQPIPDGKFGLHVERTVDIRLPRAFTVNLLGKPQHVVAPATDKTLKEYREEELVRKFFQGGD